MRDLKSRDAARDFVEKVESGGKGWMGGRWPIRDAVIRSGPRAAMSTSPSGGRTVEPVTEEGF